MDRGLAAARFRHPHKNVCASGRGDRQPPFLAVARNRPLKRTRHAVCNADIDGSASIGRASNRQVVGQVERLRPVEGVRKRFRVGCDDVGRKLRDLQVAEAVPVQPRRNDVSAKVRDLRTFRQRDAEPLGRERAVGMSRIDAPHRRKRIPRRRTREGVAANRPHRTDVGHIAAVGKQVAKRVDADGQRNGRKLPVAPERTYPRMERLDLRPVLQDGKILADVFRRIVQFPQSPCVGRLLAQIIVAPSGAVPFGNECQTVVARLGNADRRLRSVAVSHHVGAKMAETLVKIGMPRLVTKSVAVDSDHVVAESLLLRNAQVVGDCDSRRALGRIPESAVRRRTAQFGMTPLRAAYRGGLRLEVFVVAA